MLAPETLHSSALNVVPPQVSQALIDKRRSSIKDLPAARKSKALPEPWQQQPKGI